AVTAQDHLDAATAHPGEEGPGNDGVDDVAVLGELGHPDGLADIGEADVPRGQLDDLVVDSEVAGYPAGVRDVFAAGSADRERHAVGVHLPDVQQGQRAVEAAGKDDADGEVGVDPDADAIR